MKRAAAILSCVALAIMLVAPLAVFIRAIELTTCKHWMLAGTVLWFAASPIAMKRRTQ